MTPEQLDALTKALMNYRAHDMEGVFCVVSREAVTVAAGLLALQHNQIAASSARVAELEVQVETERTENRWAYVDAAMQDGASARTDAAVADALERAAAEAAKRAKFTRVAIVEATAKAIMANLVSVTQTKTANEIEDAIRALIMPSQADALAAHDKRVREAALREFTAKLLTAAGQEYILEHPMETDWHRQGRHSTVRGMMVRVGLYPELEAAIDAALIDAGGAA